MPKPVLIAGIPDESAANVSGVDINGVYVPTGKLHNSKPLFRKLRFKWNPLFLAHTSNKCKTAIFNIVSPLYDRVSEPGTPCTPSTKETGSVDSLEAILVLSFVSLLLLLLFKATQEQCSCNYR